MTGDHPESDRAQELRLTRSGCPDTEPMRPHAFLGGLLDVEFERCVRGGRADWNTKAIVGASAVPPICRGVGREIADPQEILPTRAAAGCPAERIRPASPVPGQPLSTHQRSGVTHLVRACGHVTVAG